MDGSHQPEDRLGRIRAAFDAAGYVDENIAPVLEIDGERRPRRVTLPLLLRRTAAGAPLDTLIRLFILGVPVPIGDVAPALASAPPEDWVAAGLLSFDDGQARGRLQVRYFRGLLVAFDLHDPREESLPADYVMGISTSTMNVASVMVRRPYESVLDVGTGSGFLALLAAAHSDRVVATDLNPRAVEVARLNAGLNGVPIEVIQGDLFEPVADRRFDAIVSNPPFVVAPEGSHLFLHGDTGGGDAISRRLAMEAPAHLNDGGWCQFLANWIVPADGGGDDRLRGWFDGSDCDVWVLRTHETPAARYALDWSEGIGADDDLPDRLRASLDYFEKSGIAAVGGGVVTMRKNPGTANWFRVDAAPERMELPSGDEIARGFEVRALTSASGSDWRQARPVLRQGSELDRRLRSGSEGWRPASAFLRRTAGLQYAVELDRTALLLVGAVDGERTVESIVSEAARQLSVPAEEIESQAIAIVLELYEQGFVDLEAG